MNLKLAWIYLRCANPLFATRTWQHLFDKIIRTKTGETQKRWITASKSKSFDTIRNRVLIKTRAEHLLRVMKDGKVSTNIYLRQLHNFALEINWLPAIVIPRRQWPAVRCKGKPAKTADHPNWFATQILDHNGEAVHHPRACGAVMIVPSLEEYERSAT